MGRKKIYTAGDVQNTISRLKTKFAKQRETFLNDLLDFINGQIEQLLKFQLEEFLGEDPQYYTKLMLDSPKVCVADIIFPDDYEISTVERL